LPSEFFDFGIERFCCCIGTSSIKVIDDRVVMSFKSAPDCGKGSETVVYDGTHGVRGVSERLYFASLTIYPIL
jgi:hypothetical protein